MLRSVLFSAALFASSTAAFAQPKVVVSIKPLHSLVASVMGNVGKPELLMDGNASPHDFSMRPSQAKLVQDADLIFWIGPDMEEFLTKSIETMGTGKTAVALFQEDDEHEHAESKKKHEDHDDHDHGHKKEHADHSEDAHDDHEHADAHIWLSPNDAVEMVERITVELAKADPENKAKYAANAKALSERLIELQTKSDSKLKAHRGKPFVAFHDAYSHFAEAFSLTSAGSLTINPEVTPSAKQVGKMRDKIKAQTLSCAFAEPQFPNKLLGLLTEGTSVKTGTLDPLGAELAPGPDMYFNLIEQLVGNFSQCMEQS